MKDYGYQRKTDPEFWNKVSNAIWNDSSLTLDMKMEAQNELVQEYYKEKREQKHIQTNQPHSQYENIKNRIGLAQSASIEQLKDAMRRLKGKSKVTWDALNLTEKDFDDVGV